MTILVTKTNNNNIYNYRRTIHPHSPMHSPQRRSSINGSTTTSSNNSSNSSTVNACNATENLLDCFTTSTVLAITNECENDVVASQLIQAQFNPQILELSFHRTNLCKETFQALKTLMTKREEQQPRKNPSERRCLWHTIALINCQGLVEETLDFILKADCLRCLHLGFDAGDDLVTDTVTDTSDNLHSTTSSVASLPAIQDSSDINLYDSTDSLTCTIGGLETLSRSLTSITNLESLRITAVMHAGDVAALGRAIQHNKSLRYLDLSWSCFVEDDHNNNNNSNQQDRPSIIQHLARGFRYNTTLRTLGLFGCNLSDDQMTIILRSLVEHPTLQSIALNDNKCGPKASFAASNVLAHPQCLIRQFDLSFQRVEDATTTTTAIATTTTTNDAIIEVVDNQAINSNNSNNININNVQPPRGRLNTQAIARAIQINPSSLLSLDLSSCDLDDVDAQYMAQAIEINASRSTSSSSSLQELLLSRNKITNIGIQALAHALQYNRNSNTSRPQITPPSSSSSTTDHQHHPYSRRRGLRRLSVWGNPFNEQGAQALLHALQHNNTELETLDLFREFECSEQIRHLLNLNRIGRRLLHAELPSDIPISLWPHVLVRSHQIKLIQRRQADMAKERASILFDFLRESPLLFCQR